MTGALAYQGKVCETQIDELIYELHMQEDFTCDGMIRVPYLPEMDKGVDSSEESSI